MRKRLSTAGMVAERLHRFSRCETHRFAFPHQLAGFLLAIIIKCLVKMLTTCRLPIAKDRRALHQCANLESADCLDRSAHRLLQCHRCHQKSQYIVAIVSSLLWPWSAQRSSVLCVEAFGILEVTTVLGDAGVSVGDDAELEVADALLWLMLMGLAVGLCGTAAMVTGSTFSFVVGDATIGDDNSGTAVVPLVEVVMDEVTECPPS